MWIYLPSVTRLCPGRERFPEQLLWIHTCRHLPPFSPELYSPHTLSATPTPPPLPPPEVRGSGIRPLGVCCTRTGADECVCARSQAGWVLWEALSLAAPGLYRCCMALLAHKLSFRLEQAHKGDNVNTVPFTVVSWCYTQPGTRVWLNKLCLLTRQQGNLVTKAGWGPYQCPSIYETPWKPGFLFFCEAWLSRFTFRFHFSPAHEMTWKTFCPLQPNKLTKTLTNHMYN